MHGKSCMHAWECLPVACVPWLLFTWALAAGEAPCVTAQLLLLPDVHCLSQKHHACMRSSLQVPCWHEPSCSGPGLWCCPPASPDAADLRAALGRVAELALQRAEGVHLRRVGGRQVQRIARGASPVVWLAAALAGELQKGRSVPRGRRG